MKAKNPSTGNFEEVYVKALDSLPVGSEIDFTGSVSDIPVGWEEVDNVLWTNSNPTTAISTETTITLANDDYDFLEIFTSQNINDTRQYSTKISKGVSGRVFIINALDGTVGFRNLNYVDSTHYTLTTVSNAGDNSYIIPVKIIGHKL